ncbi:MAG: hypothetical protein E6G44_04590 [Actinobacteria bacterium]|nr:MAG: hypothetical protein E6G44_04590 [Actinomycetota bacterium]
MLDPPSATSVLTQTWAYGADSGRQQLSAPRKPLAFVLAFLLVAGVGAYLVMNRSGSASGTTFSLALAKDQTFRYQLGMSFNGSVVAGSEQVPFNVSATEIVSWRVLSVNADGVAMIQMRIESMTSKVNGRRTPAALPPPFTIRVAKDGRVLTAGNMALLNGDNPGSMFPGSDQFMPLLPDHPVKPGDFWTKTFDQDFPFGSGHLHYVTKNLFLRYETVDGVRAAVISSTIELPLDFSIDLDQLAKAVGGSSDFSGLPKGAKMIFGGSAKVTEISWLDLAHGALVNGSANGTIDMDVRIKGLPELPGLPGNEIRMNGNMSLTVKHLSDQPAPTPSAKKPANKKRKGS